MHIAFLKTHTVIIGAGITGLSTAHFLSKKTNDFLLIEKENRVGGNLHSEKIDGFLLENGPNTVLINNPSIQQLINDCQLENALIFPSEAANKNRYILRRGALQVLPKNPKEVVTTPILKWHEKLAIFKDLFLPKNKQNTSVSSFVKYRFGKGVLDSFIEPFLTGIYAGDIEKMSAKHTLKKGWDLEQKYGSIIKGLKQKATTKNPQIFNFSEGLSFLTQTLAKKNAKHLMLNTSVQQIQKLKNGFQLTTNKNTIQCQRIISTVPAFVLASIIEDYHFKKALNSIEYVPVDVFHFGFKKEDVKNQKQGFGVLTKPSDKKHFLGILFNNRIFPHVCSNDNELFTVIVGGSKQGNLCKQAPETLQPLVLNEINEILECYTDPIFSNHVRYPKGIPQYHLNYEKFLKDVDDFKKNNANFHILGNYLNGVSVSDCIQNAHLLVKILN